MKKINPKKLSSKNLGKLCSKAAFARYVDKLKVSPTPNTQCWECCQIRYQHIKDVQKHVALNHMHEVQSGASLLTESLNHKDDANITPSVYKYEMPVVEFQCCCGGNQHLVLLFYHYVNIECCASIIEWQTKLCKTLNLTGKIRVANEGVNGTVEGCSCATEEYKQSVLKHPLFSSMASGDFKTSPGNGNSFDGLALTVCSELCTMGISTDNVKSTDGAEYVTPDEMHRIVQDVKSNPQSKEKGPLLLDCRNFYESKIGYFEGAVKPDLRKFSYFPEYVNHNKEMFTNRTVVMYCTGGIRCERASAYVKQATECSQVLQLKGGIHKYMEKYPDGHYKGKLFVFDNRYSIGDSDAVVSNCQRCKKPFDQYQLCSTVNCRQLVLICDDCRTLSHTTCCGICAKNSGQVSLSKQCECTQNRTRVSVENVHNSNKI